ncbi:MAG: peptidase M48, partial [Chitinophagaceae bacterium]
MKKLISFGMVAATVFAINSCAKNPVTGKRQVVFTSEAQEIAMGQEADPQIIAQYGLYEDSTLQRFINEKGKAMAAISHRPNLQYHFRVVDSDILNAFAVPGGYVYFTRGIMAHFNNEAEFAGVLGHEIGHITARHTVVQQSKQVFGQLGLIAGMIIKPELGQFAEQASQGLGLLFLKFGRDAERQSDQLGVEYSSKINYNAHE